jgi:TfoX/Sxy family transcriptional regulator of competence genes
MADCLAAIGEKRIRQRNVFGGRGFLVGRLTFAIAWNEGIIVKMARAEYESALKEPGVTRFTWVVVASDAIADDPELIEWLRRGLRAVR